MRLSISSFPEILGLPEDVNDGLRRQLLQCQFRIQNRQSRAWIVEVFRRFVHLQFSYDSLMIMIYLGRFQIIMGNDIPCYDSLIIMIYLGWSQIIMGNDILWSMFVGIRQHANFQAIWPKRNSSHLVDSSPYCCSNFYWRKASLSTFSRLCFDNSPYCCSNFYWRKASLSTFSRLCWILQLFDIPLPRQRFTSYEKIALSTDFLQLGGRFSKSIYAKHLLFFGISMLMPFVQMVFNSTI